MRYYHYIGTEWVPGWVIIALALGLIGYVGYILIRDKRNK